MGAGGVGGYFGGRLQLTGNEVQYVARRARLRALRTEGLKLTSTGDTRHLPVVDATDDLSALRDPALVLVAVKSWDTEDVARQLAPAISADTTVLSLQNGALARDVLGHHGPVAEVHVPRRLSATTAIARSPDRCGAHAPGVTRSAPGAHDRGDRPRAAPGGKLDNTLPEDRLRFCNGLPYDVTSSTANDLAHGRRLELDWLSGYVVSTSDRLELSAPANRVIAAALAPYVDGQAP